MVYLIVKNNNHTCSHSSKPDIVCPRKQTINFINEHKRQEINNILTAAIECCDVNVTEHTNKYAIAE